MEKIIEAIIREDMNSRSGQILPKEIATKVVQRLKEIEYIKHEYNRYCCGKSDARKIFDETVKSIDAQIANLRKKCKHEDTTYYPDPSGNNDSYTECNICGAEV